MKRFPQTLCSFLLFSFLLFHSSTSACSSTPTGNNLSPINFLLNRGDELVFSSDYSEISSCFPVQNLTISSLIGTSAIVSWTPVGTPDSYKIELTNNLTGSTVIDFTNDTFYVVSQLTQTTSYNVSVTSNCSGVFSSPVTRNFITPCIEGGAVVIGNPTSNSLLDGNLLPFANIFEYSFSQQIFEAAEVGNVDTIFGIAFQYYDTTSLTRNLTIYLGQTSQSEFLGIYSYIPFSNFQQVFQGNVTFYPTGNGWFNIQFPAGYEYHADSNLVVAISDQSGFSSPGNCRFKTHGGFFEVKSLYYGKNGGTFDIMYPPYGAFTSSISSIRSNIKFITPCDIAPCNPPNLLCLQTGSTSATLSIVPGLNETSWLGEYKKTTDLSWISLGLINTTNYVLQNLDPMTNYLFRVRNICNVSDSSSWQSIAFTTDCGTINQIPYSENFDSYQAQSDPIPHCWTRNYNGEATPYLTTESVYSAPNSIYFATTDTTYCMFVLPPVNPNIPVNTLQISFKGKMGYLGGVLSDNIQIGVMTDPYDYSTFTPLDTLVVNIFSALYYQHFSFPLTGYTGNGNYIAVVSDLRNYGYENHFHIDNLVIEYAPTCLPPSNVQITNITNTGATIQWIPNSNGNATSFEVVIGLQGVNPNTAIPITVTDTFFTFSGLSETTQYKCYVRAVCSGNEFSQWTPVASFTTNIAAGVPYFEPFNSLNYPVGYLLSGWGIGGVGGVTGNPANNLFSQNQNNSYFRTIAIGPLSNNMELTFDFKWSMYQPPYNAVPANRAYFCVGISTDWGATYSFIDTVYSNAVIGYQPYSLDLSPYTGQFINIKVKTRIISGDIDLGIDNISVADTLTCKRPTQVRADAIYPGNILLNWNENSSATEWMVEYGPSGFTPGNGIMINTVTKPLSITNLNSETLYDFYVRSVCNLGDSSKWSYLYRVVTACPAIPLPFSEDFSGATIPSCWSQYIDGTLTHNLWSVSFNNWCGGSPNELRAIFQTGIGVSRLISPLINFTGYSDPYLTFKHKYNDDPGVLNFKIQTSSDRVNWVDQPFSFSSGNGSIAPTGVYVPLNISSNNQYIAWVIDGNHYDFMNWSIDDVSVTGSLIPCSTPTGLTINSYTDSSAMVSWTPVGFETRWKVEYLMIPDTTWTEIIAHSPSIELTGLESYSYYLIRVKSLCIYEESDYTIPVLLTTFENPTIYNITASCGLNGTITPSGNVGVTSGESQTFHFIPHENYQIGAIVIDGIAETTLSNNYTFTNVQQDHTIFVDFTTDVAENDLGKWIAIYPNPAASILHLHISSMITDVKVCNIYNVCGQLIKNIDIHHELTQIDVCSFTPGVYYFVIECEQGLIFKKFIRK